VAQGAQGHRGTPFGSGFGVALVGAAVRRRRR
ncbi:MAG: hypothetical protein DRJ42_22905, partial [Deltaproteobacteria bacterium]